LSKNKELEEYKNKIEEEYKIKLEKEIKKIREKENKILNEKDSFLKKIESEKKKEEYKIEDFKQGS
jgi:hypothetical protein